MTNRPDLEHDLTHPESSDPKAAAREQFVHGLLLTLHRDTNESSERRITAVLQKLDSQVIVNTRKWRWHIIISGLAAALVITTLVILGTQTGGNALAMIQASIAASRTVGDRRYAIDVALASSSPDMAPPRATLDVRDPDHFVIEAFSAYGDKITLGRDSTGGWAIKLTGEADRYPPRTLLSQWVSFGTNTLMLVAIDDLLGTLAKSYTLKRLPREALDSGVSCDRVSASHAAGDGPERVELWLDPTSHIVRRAELYWDSVSATAAPPPRPPHAGSPPDGHRVPSPGPPPDGPPPEGDYRGPPPDGGPMHDLGQPLPPPPDRRYTAPPRKAVFQLVDCPALPDNWFAPELHAQPQGFSR